MQDDDHDPDVDVDQINEDDDEEEGELRQRRRGMTQRPPSLPPVVTDKVTRRRTWRRH
jgi:hypothetical protein